jgi:hypothetical protein
MFLTSPELIDKKFGELVCAGIPVFDGEIQGLYKLKRVLNNKIPM